MFRIGNNKWLELKMQLYIGIRAKAKSESLKNFCNNMLNIIYELRYSRQKINNTRGV